MSSVIHRSSLKIIIALIIIVSFLHIIAFYTPMEYEPDYLVEMAAVPVGSTVFSGDHIIDSNAMKYPILGNLNFLQSSILNLDVLGVISAIFTGTVSVPVSHISQTGILANGQVTSFDGPGVLVYKNNKLSVLAPENFLWAKSVPYTYAVKTEKGIDIVQNNKTIKAIEFDQIKNETVPHDFVSADYIYKWAKNGKIGKQMVIEYGLSNFSDNRSLVSPEKIKEYFGEEVYKYTCSYPLNRPVLIYSHDYKEENLTTAMSVLGSYPQYGNAGRESNARQFVKAWNGTFVAPKSFASGNALVGFTSLRDVHATGGAAAHGVCPPARSLRAAVMSAGFPLPIGMNGAHEAVNYDVSPSTEILVYNPYDYPVKILMWTEGSGTGLRIYTKLVKLVEN
ncbi:hypothetical protein [Methanobrevibacter curvatus]|nr:hypothetical protein [Methanobrevibacter curvatus]